MKHTHGKFFMQVEDKGQLWYIDPDTGERSYLGPTGQDMIEWVRKTANGISNADLAKIPVAKDSLPTNVPVPPAVAMEQVLPVELYHELPVSNQGKYPICGAINVVQACEEAYKLKTGEDINFSIPQLYIEAGGAGGGLSTTKVNEIVEEVGLIKEVHNELPEDLSKKPSDWIERWRDAAKESEGFMRFKFKPLLIDSKLNGSEEDLEKLKRSIKQYRHVVASVDVQRGWDTGTPHNGDKWDRLHRIVLSGWNNDYIIGHNSWGDTKHRVTLDKNYPAAWVYAFEYIQ